MWLSGLVCNPYVLAAFSTGPLVLGLAVRPANSLRRGGLRWLGPSPFRPAPSGSSAVARDSPTRHEVSRAALSFLLSLMKSLLASLHQLDMEEEVFPPDHLGEKRAKQTTDARRRRRRRSKTTLFSFPTSSFCTKYGAQGSIHVESDLSKLRKKASAKNSPLELQERLLYCGQISITSERRKKERDRPVLWYRSCGLRT